MRVTEFIKSRSTNHSLRSSMAAEQRATDQIASGKRVQNFSDDPIAAAMAERLTSARARHQGHVDVASRLLGEFESAEGALGAAHNVLARAREVAMQLGSGAQTAVTLQAGAQEVQGLLDQLVDLGNQVYGDHFLFGGTADQAPPYEANGNYVGSATGREIAVGERSRVTVPSGEEVLSADAFGGLRELRDALAAGDQDAVRAATDTLDLGFDQLSAARQNLGHDLNTLEHVRSFSENMVLQNTLDVSRLTDTDLPEAIGDLKDAQTSLRALGEIASRQNELGELFLRF